MLSDTHQAANAWWSGVCLVWSKS